MINSNRMNGNVSEDSQSTASVEIPFDEQFGKSLEAGLGAIQQVFAGFVKAARDLAGPEMMRNIQAASWVSSVADSLESIIKAPSSDGMQLGELQCYSEQLVNELTGSRFAPQIDSFRAHLATAEGILKKTQQSQESLSSDDTRLISSAAGYFRAASKTVLSGASASK